MWIRERITTKVIILMALVAMLPVGAIYVAVQNEQATVPVPEPEPEPVPEPEPELILDLEPIVELIPELEIEPEPEPEPEPIPEPEPEPIPKPEPIEIIPPPIPIPPPELPDVPDEIPNIDEAEIRERVDRFNAQSGTPVPADSAVSGTVSRVHSGQDLEINGVLINLLRVNLPTGDDAGTTHAGTAPCRNGSMLEWIDAEPVRPLSG